MFIGDLGWDAYFEALRVECVGAGCVPARVISQHRGLWRVAGDFEECWAEPSGKLRKEAEAGGDWPAVGDWVSAEILAGRPNATIQHPADRARRTTSLPFQDAATRAIAAALIRTRATTVGRSAVRSRPVCPSVTRGITARIIVPMAPAVSA